MLPRRLTLLAICFCALLEMLSAFRLGRHQALAFPRRTAARMLSGEAETPKTFVGFSVYKGKAAMSVKAIPATFSTGPGPRTVTREGALLLEFAPSGEHQQEYDWTKKVLFSLDAVECGELLLVGQDKSAEFFHDPNAKSRCLPVSFPLPPLSLSASCSRSSPSLTPLFASAVAFLIG